jgi:hypothetical protein
MRKRLKHRPSRSEVEFAPEPTLRKPWPPPRLERTIAREDGRERPDGDTPERPFKHTPWKSGGDCNIQMHFAKGTKGGRKKGVPNHFTRVMREAAILAAEDAKQANGQGLYGYLLWCAENIPHVYLRSVLSKLIPMRVDLNSQMRLQSADEIKAELRARGIPIPDSLFPVPKVPPNIVRLEPMPVDNAHALVIDNNEEEPTDDDRADQAPAPDAAESRSVR